MGPSRRYGWKKRVGRKNGIYERKSPSNIINETNWHPITCDSRMGELAGGFHPGGISAPCQPPLVTTESPSPPNLPKKTLWIVDFLFPRNLLLSSRVLLSIDRSLRFAVGLGFRSLGFLLPWPWRSVSTSLRRGGGAVSVR